MQQFVFYPVSEFDGVLNEIFKAPEGSRYKLGFCEKTEEDVVFIVNEEEKREEIIHHMKDIIPLLECKLGMKLDNHGMVEFERNQYGLLFTTPQSVI